jgi:hypothetical protein
MTHLTLQFRFMSGRNALLGAGLTYLTRLTRISMDVRTNQST